jgi:aspartyl-tRNA(Asn)/glutamyl-tRNA(Gln) amidotransferase subunit B
MINGLNIRAGDLKLTPVYLAELIQMIDAGTINVNTAKELLLTIQEKGKSPQELVEQLGLSRVSDEAAIRRVIEQVLAESPQELASYRNGKLGLMGWFTGQVMKKMGGKADAAIARKILEELLK